MHAPDVSAIPASAITEVCLCHHLRRSARAVSRAYDRVLQPLGIKASQFNVLAAVAACETATMAGLADVLAMERTTLLRNIQPLRNDGYLEARGRGAKAALTLTVTGQALLTEASHAWRIAQQTLTQRIGASKAGALLQTLSGIVAL